MMQQITNLANQKSPELARLEACFEKFQDLEVLVTSLWVIVFNHIWTADTSDRPALPASSDEDARAVWGLARMAAAMVEPLGNELADAIKQLGGQIKP